MKREKRKGKSLSGGARQEKGRREGRKALLDHLSTQCTGRREKEKLSGGGGKCLRKSWFSSGKKGGGAASMKRDRSRRGASFYSLGRKKGAVIFCLLSNRKGREKKRWTKGDVSILQRFRQKKGGLPLGRKKGKKGRGKKKKEKVMHSRKRGREGSWSLSATLRSERAIHEGEPGSIINISRKERKSIFLCF